MRPWWVTWYEHPLAKWRGAEDARAWEIGWRWCDGWVRCAGVVFAPTRGAASVRLGELIGGSFDMALPVEMTAPPPNHFRGAEQWWDEMTSRRAA